MPTSFIGFVSLPFLSHGDLTTVSALFTGIGFIATWQYCLALGLGADFCGRGCYDRTACTIRLNLRRLVTRLYLDGLILGAL